MEQQEDFGFAKRHGLLALSQDETAAKVIYQGQPSPTAILELRRHLQKKLTLSAVNPDEFARSLTQVYEHRSNTAEQVAATLGEDIDLSKLFSELPATKDLLESQDDAPIIRLLNALLSEAIKQQASDIHIETFEDHISVRFRIDGMLRELLRPERVLAPLIVSRIKVMARLDIAEKRLPQDGRIALKIAGHAIDIRVSTMPSSHGERVVLRILDQKSGSLDLTELGMDPATRERIEHLIAIPHGILLVSGPTGSGKTTTLYAILTRLNNVSRNILTVEDPIEYYLPGIGQTQVNTRIDMTFARGLRSILRQDPDIVMVGEIRDRETAEIAVQASLTGHLVLSTLHTNSAIGAVTRLTDMNIEPFLISTSLIGVLAQRLVRVLCKDCKVFSPATEPECKVLNLDPKTKPELARAKGCPHCMMTGYHGRTGIYELIAMDDTLRTMVHEKASEQTMLAYARTTCPAMSSDGHHKIISGITTLEEVMRVIEE